MSSARTAGRALLPALLLVVAAQCTKLPYEPIQILVVEAATSGSGLDPDGYVATVDGVMSAPLDANGSASFDGLGPGEHQVAIEGVAGNCAVDGPNPRSIVVAEDAITQEVMSVSCLATRPPLVVHVETRGYDGGAEGYTIAVDGRELPVDGTGSITVHDLPEGDHPVSLGGVPEDCEVLGPNPRLVTEDVDETTFDVACSPEAERGTITIDLTSSGSRPDTDGYTVTVGGTQVAADANGSVAFDDLPAGDYTVALGDLAEECTAEDNPRVVKLLPGGTAATTFEVTCGPPGVPLVIEVATTGTDVDTDGYLVSIDGVDLPVGPTGTVTVEDVPIGERLVTLTGLSPNCSVQGDNPQAVEVTGEGTSRVSFDVVCQGSIVVATETTGNDLDPDGYTISVEGTSAITRLPTNGETLVEGVPGGEQILTLGGIAPNCSVDGDNPRTVTVLPEGAGQVSFRVRCEAPGS